MKKLKKIATAGHAGAGNPQSLTGHEADIFHLGLKPGQCLNDLKRSVFCKSEKRHDTLYKMGAMARKFPFNPQNMHETDEETISQWQSGDIPEYSDPDIAHSEFREAVPSMDMPARMRALNKLRAQTRTKKENGTTMYLLHRGMSLGEHEKSVTNTHVNHEGRTSWTPHKGVASDFAMGKYHKMVSAWIPEDKIVNIPKQYGKLTDPDQYQPEKPKGTNRFALEHEVIVEGGHNSPLASKGDLEPIHGTDIHHVISERGKHHLWHSWHDISSNARTEYLNRLRNKINKSELRPGQCLNDLKKMGAMHRLAPMKGGQKLDAGDKSIISEWQKLSTRDERKELQRWRDAMPRTEGSHRVRALRDLASKTPSKLINGKRHFLLHRGMSPEEHLTTVNEGRVNHTRASSWTPRKKTADDFGYCYSSRHFEGEGENKRYIINLGKTVSAWINEDHIQNIPLQHGEVRASHGNGSNTFGNEHEVIVQSGHNSHVESLEDSKAPESYDHNQVPSELNERINYKSAKFKWGYKDTRHSAPADYKISKLKEQKSIRNQK